MSDNKHCLIISESGRALARSARRGGHDVHVLDCFGDRDTVGYTQTCHTVTGFVKDDEVRAIVRHIEGLADRYPNLNIVMGGGLERNLDLWSYLAARFSVIGNPPRTIKHIKNPRTFFNTLDNLRLPYPAYYLSPHARLSGDFIVKSVAYAGGAHIKPYHKGMVLEPSCYLQALLVGRSFSATFLGDGERSIVLGFNELVLRSRPNDFTFSGAFSNADLCLTIRRQITQAIAQLTSAYSLRGLCGLDFIVDELGGYAIVELNPRPTATFALYEQKESLLAYHLAACSGNLPEYYAPCEHVHAFNFIYAHRAMLMPYLTLPAWVSDRPAVGHVIAKDTPVCTVQAIGDNITETKEKLATRTAQCEQLLKQAA